MRRLLLLACVLLSLGGCRETPHATLAGGKPVDYWVKSLHDGDAKARKTAVAKLGNVGSTNPAVLPALTEALHDADPAVRREAILAVAKFGPQAAATVPTLEQMARADSDPTVRDYATKAGSILKTAAESK